MCGPGGAPEGTRLMIDGDTTPGLPTEFQVPRGMGQIVGEEGLTFASTESGETTEKAPAGEALEVEAWVDAVGELEERTTVLLALAQGEGVELDAVAELMLDIHRPVGGVGVLGEGNGLIMVLPDGLGWETVLETVDCALPTGVSATAGLADAGGHGQTLVDAIRLAKRAALDAANEGERAMARSLADENAEAHDKEVARSLVDSLESGTGLRLVFQPKFDAREPGRMVGGLSLIHI